MEDMEKNTTTVTVLSKLSVLTKVDFDFAYLFCFTSCGF